MCAKETDSTDNRFKDSFGSGMEEMIRDFCPGVEGTPECCPRFPRMNKSSTGCCDQMMAMCEPMQENFFRQALKKEKK